MVMSMSGVYVYLCLCRLCRVVSCGVMMVVSMSKKCGDVYVFISTLKLRSRRNPTSSFMSYFHIEMAEMVN